MKKSGFSNSKFLYFTKKSRRIFRVLDYVFTFAFIAGSVHAFIVVPSSTLPWVLLGAGLLNGVLVVTKASDRLNNWIIQKGIARATNRST